jgi:hypothetical protein
MRAARSALEWATARPLVGDISIVRISHPGAHVAGATRVRGGNPTNGPRRRTGSRSFSAPPTHKASVIQAFY